jgi:hypothetical protein
VSWHLTLNYIARLTCIHALAATSRLEDVALAAQQSSFAPGTSTRSTEQVHDQLTSHLAPSSGGASAAADSASSAKEEAPTAPAVKAYQEMIIDGPLQEYIQKSKDAGGIIGEQVRSCGNTRFIYRSP